MLLRLPVETCMKAVNVVGLDIQNGVRFQPDHIYEGILKFPHLCCFKEVDQKFYRQHVGYALWFYESDPFPMLQCFWSDHRGHFPWDEGCSLYARDAQPLRLLAQSRYPLSMSRSARR